MWLPLHWTSDLSYGTYIYAFPVTQLLVLAGAARFGPIGLALSAGVATLVIAAASWFLIERPAIALKSIATPRPSPAGARCARLTRARTDPARADRPQSNAPSASRRSRKYSGRGRSSVISGPGPASSARRRPVNQVWRAMTSTHSSTVVAGES